MNLGQFRTAVANELGLDNDPATEQPSIDDAVNEGVLRVLADTHCYVKETIFSGFDGSSTDYTFDSSIFEIVDAYFTGQLDGLERVSVDELIEHKRMSTTTGPPTRFLAVNGENMLQFWPPPGTGDTLNMWYVPVPTALSGSADNPAIATFGGVPSYFHRAIKWWACSEAASADDDESSAQGSRYRQWYSEEIKRYRRHMRRRGGNRNQRARVNDTNRRIARHTNDIY